LYFFFPGSFRLAGKNFRRLARMFGYSDKATNGNGSARAGHHIISIDVEDWPQSTLDHNLPIGERVVANTRAFLELLDEAGVCATFFVLGKVAERHPSLALEIARAGHEVATHGYSHESLESMTRPQFKEELHRAVEILRDQTGLPVHGHRAADFSISERRLYFLELLLQEGLSYDSSIFPIRLPRYGVNGAQRHPHLIRCASGGLLVEFPPATVKLAGFVLPGAGGGYFRLFPYWWTRLTLRNIERSQHPGTCYFHPYEIDEEEIQKITYEVPPILRLSQFTNRKTVREKFRRLLKNFRFTTMIESCRSLNRDNVPVALDLGVLPIRYGNANYLVRR
jgi:polysaccharide deacetylase family protein (PEP-CTERM system associated)